MLSELSIAVAALLIGIAGGALAIRALTANRRPTRRRKRCAPSTSGST